MLWVCDVCSEKILGFSGVLKKKFLSKVTLIYPLNILLVPAEFLLKFLPKILAISTSLNFLFGKQLFGSLSCA